MKKTGRIGISDILLGILIALIAYLILNGLSLSFNLNSLIDSAFISIVLTSVLTFAVNRWLWKYGWIRSVLNIQVPRIEGRWEGYIKSSYDNFSKEHSVVLEIFQTSLETRLIYYDENATSRCLLASFVMDEGAPPLLICVYRNEPLRAERDLQIHYGTMILVIDETKLSMDGTYFNHQQQRSTYGQICLVLKSRKLLKAFRNNYG